MSADPRLSTIGEIVQLWAERRPDAPAFVAEDSSPLTYGALADLIDRFGRSLNGAGFGRNDRIGIVHSGGPALATTLLGITSFATAVPLVTSYTLGEFAIHLHDRKVQALAIEAGLDTPARAAAARQGIPVLEVATVGGSVAGSVTLQAGSGPAARQPGPASPEDVMLVMATSGTTSQSKIVPLRHRHIMLRTFATTTLLELGENDRCLNLQPLNYTGGINNIFVSLYTGGSVIFMPQLQVATFFRYLESLGPTWYIGSYTMQYSIYAQAPNFEDAIRRSRLRFIRTTSGFIDFEIAKGMEELFGVPVIEAYSSTETGRIAGNPMPPGKRKRGTVGLPLIQEVAIMDEGGRHLPTGERGEVVVRGDQVFDGYEDNPAANNAAFVDGWYRTGDEGFFDREGYLTLTGRISETINRGGEKIAPAEVDAALLKHPEVREAATFPIPHPTLGEEAAAAVVLERGAAVSDQELARFLRQHLAGFKVPRRILVVAAIPKSANGKVRRRSLAQALELDLAAPAAVEKAGRDVGPRTVLEAQLEEIWARSLGLERVGVHDDFFLLGGDSLQAVELFLRIEEELGFRLPRSSLFEAGTVAEQAEIIKAAAPPGCVVPIQPEGSRPPFFCVHYGNGPVLNFRGLARYLGPDQPFYGLQYVEPVGDQGPFTRIEAMAAHYLAELRKVQPEGPYYLGGYSFGGRVAYVMAQQLRAAGEEVAFLALFDTYSWVGRRYIEPRQRLAVHRARIAEVGLGAYVALVLRHRREVFFKMLDPLFSTKLWRSFEAFKRPISRDHRPPDPIAIETIRRTYRARPYDSSAVLFKAELEGIRHPDRHDGWHQLIKGGLEVRPIPGQHTTIMNEPHVRTLAAELAQCLEASYGRQSARFQSRMASS